jgi:glycosyltransferase involved in cell wall biosynthesis
MSSLSVCVIAKNEAQVIEKSLASIAPIADEVIFVDTGSTDETLSIAKKFTDKIYCYKWIDDFAAARNYCDDKATKQYCFRWDADFYIDEGNKRRLLTAKKNSFADANIVQLKWITERTGNNTISLLRDLIYKRGEFHYQYPIHAKVVPNRGVDVVAKAYPDTSIEHAKDKQNKAHRYEQTTRLLEKLIIKNPDDVYLRIQQIEGLIFDQDFLAANETITKVLLLDNDESTQALLVEKQLFCLLSMDKITQAHKIAKKYEKTSQYFPRLLLMIADVYVFSDQKQAAKLYQQFITLDFKQSDTSYSYNTYRYRVHPYMMLCKIAYEEGDQKQIQNLYKKLHKNLLRPQDKAFFAATLR